MKSNLLYIVVMSLLCIITQSCGGGGGGGSSSFKNTALDPGSASLDVSQLSKGVLHITWPDAQGNNPGISALDVSGSGADGLADLRNTSGDSYDIRSDGVTVYFPVPGSFTLTITINDAGDSALDQIINVTVPADQAYTVNGSVADGALNSESGVRTWIRLYWNPIAYPNQSIAVSESDQSSNGNFSFSGLIGNADYFRIRVDSGTH